MLLKLDLFPFGVWRLAIHLMVNHFAVSDLKKMFLIQLAHLEEMLPDIAIAFGVNSLHAICTFWKECTEFAWRSAADPHHQPCVPLNDIRVRVRIAFGVSWTSLGYAFCKNGAYFERSVSDPYKIKNKIKIKK